MVKKEKGDIGILDEFKTDFSKLVDETENITELLGIWQELAVGLKAFEELNERLRIKIKNYLKERQWDRYLDKKSKIGITLTTQSRENIDKKQLRLMLTEAQMAQVISVSTFERLNIITSKRRKELSKIVRK